jgi:hypothetical protein
MQKQKALFEESIKNYLYKAESILKIHLYLLDVPNMVIRGISKYQQLKNKSTATALNIVLPQCTYKLPKSNLIELPDNRRLRRHLTNDLPTRYFSFLSYLSESGLYNCL